MIDWYVEIVVLYRYTVGSVRTEHHVFLSILSHVDLH